LAYIGRQPQLASYKKVDDFSATFGGVTSFELKNDGDWLDVGTEQQLVVSLGGVIQEPGAAYTINNTTPLQSNVVFTTAPDLGTDFFAYVLGDTLDAGSPSDSSVTPNKISAGYDLASIWEAQSAAHTANASDRIMADTSLGTWQLRLPIAASDGDYVEILDYKDTWGTNNLTVSIGIGSGHFIENGVAEDLICDVTGAKIKLVYINAQGNWRVYQ
jgi:hypothetical protein